LTSRRVISNVAQVPVNLNASVYFLGDPS